MFDINERNKTSLFFISIKRGFFLRNMSVDAMKVTLAVMVVGIHTHFLSEVNQLVSYVLNQGLFRVAVPIFFIINGYYFSTAITSGKAASWLKKIVVLYLCWMGIYLFEWWELDEFSFFGLAKNVHTIIFGYFHLWYLPATVGAAMLISLFRRLSARYLAALIICTFSIGVFGQYAGNFHFAESSAIDRVLNMGWVYRNFLFCGLPFFGIGYMLATGKFESNITHAQALLGASVGIFLVLAESYTNYILIGKGENFDLLFSLIFACPAIFIFIKKIPLEGDGRLYSLCASGIYFVHPLSMSLLWGYGFRGLALVGAVLLFSLVATAGLIFMNRKLKFLL